MSIKVELYLHEGQEPTDFEKRILTALAGGGLDAGGTLPPGLTTVTNDTGEDEEIKNETVGSVGVKVRPSDDEDPIDGVTIANGPKVDEDEEPKVDEDEGPKVEEKPKRRRRTKAQIEADRKAEEEAKRAAEEDAVAAEEAHGDTDDEPEDEDLLGEDVGELRKRVRKIAGKLLASGNREKVQELLGKYEAPKLTAVPDDKVAEFLEALGKVQDEIESA